MSVINGVIFPLIFFISHTFSYPVHIFGFHKDESRLLPHWVQYHLRIVKTPSKIHIIDNGSTNPESRRQLSILHSKGIDIISYQGGFKGKSEILTREMRKFKKSPLVLVPLDVDEYIVHLLPDNKFSVDADLIVRSFQSLPYDGFKYKFSTISAFACNIPMVHSKLLEIRHFGYAQSNCISKTFFFSYGFLSTDQGNHYGKVLRDMQCKESDPTYQPLCGQCSHNNTRLATVHFGGDTSFTFNEYSEKMSMRAKEYNFTDVKSRQDCLVYEGGRHYCYFMVKNRNWPRHAVEKQFLDRTSCSFAYYTNDFRNVMKELPSLM